MPRFNLWSRSAPRTEIDQRSREARLRFERTDEFFIIRRTVARSRLRRLLYVFTVGRYGGLPHGDGEVNEPASIRWFLALLGFLAKKCRNLQLSRRSRLATTNHLMLKE